MRSFKSSPYGKETFFFFFFFFLVVVFAIRLLRICAYDSLSCEVINW